MFSKAQFILSAADPKQFPTLKGKNGNELPEIAVVGKSNVGKSSLINHLTQIKDLARVSSTPGKTQLINFFTIDDQFTFVDLPGYGFAKVPKPIRERWGKLVQAYLEKRKNLCLILFLCDLRHPPTKEDLEFARWAAHFQKPFLIVFTKADKLNQSQVHSQEKKNFALLLEQINDISLAYVSYSIKEGGARIRLIKEIEKRIP